METNLPKWLAALGFEGAEDPGEEGACCGWRPMHVAGVEGNVAVLRELLKTGKAGGVDVRTSEKVLGVWADKGLTPLMCAAQYITQPETAVLTAEALLDLGADARARSEEGWSVLYLACMCPAWAPLVRLLLDRGADADVNKASGGTIPGETPLHAAATFERPEAAALLIERGANVDHMNSFGQTAMMRACLISSGRVLEVLLKAKADPDARWAMDLESARGLEPTLPRNIAPRLTQAAGCTALHLALRHGDEGGVKQLLAAGADPEIANHAGDTPLPVAQCAESGLGVQLLEEAISRKHSCSAS